MNFNWLKNKSSSTDSPFVAVDVNPVMGFEQQINDARGMDFLRPPDAVKHFEVGKIDFEAKIISIRIFEKKKHEDWVNFLRIWASETPPLRKTIFKMGSGCRRSRDHDSCLAIDKSIQWIKKAPARAGATYVTCNRIVRY